MSDSSAAISLPLAELLQARHLRSRPSNKVVTGLGPWAGPFRSRHRGQGIDFDDLRKYSHGDDVRHIDWKVTARFNEPHTRVFHDEKEHVVTLALDFRSSQFTGSHTLRAVEAGHLAAVLLWAVAASGSRVGVVVLTDNGIDAIAPTAGDKAAIAGCRLVANCFDKARLQLPDQSVPAPLTELIDWLQLGGRQLGNIVLLCSLDNPGKEFDESLASLAKARNTAIVLIEDLLEVDGVPAGRYRYQLNGKQQWLTLGKRQVQALKEELRDRRESLLSRCARSDVPVFTSLANKAEHRDDLDSRSIVLQGLVTAGLLA